MKEGVGRTITMEIRNHGDGTMKTQGGRLRFVRLFFFHLRAFSVRPPRPPCSTVTPKTPGISDEPLLGAAQVVRRGIGPHLGEGSREWTVPGEEVLEDEDGIREVHGAVV